MDFVQIQRWTSEVAGLIADLKAAKLACEEAKKEREKVQVSLRRSARQMRELFEEFYAASGPFIDLGSADFAFEAGGALGAAMIDAVGDTSIAYDEFGFSQ